jgi:hypothetical protein
VVLAVIAELGLFGANDSWKLLWEQPAAGAPRRAAVEPG